MINFGARLSLKDNMYATLQKNLKMQKEFSEQVKRTDKSVKTLAKAKIAPVIQAKDKASAVVNKVKDNLKTAGKMVAKPFIQVKDKATTVLNKTKNTLKTIGKTVAKPFVALRDRASPIINKIKSGLKTIGSTTAKAMVALKDGATAGLSKMKSILGTLAKGATIAIGIAGAGATALLGGSLKEGASLEQSIGGIETLFKGDAGAVKANADMAYKTAGLSANAYMEQVTSFSASLLQSLSGDTAKSAKVADMAIVDMADNANKMGTSMDLIQNAYQGFAKQNYTMLDNLKLGYGGTKEEMQRLLKDAQKISGVKYDMSNLSDVYSAIHVIQKDLGITGTTAKEASATFSGSFASMKASVSNLLGNMAIGGDIEGSMTELVESASTFLFNNAIPMIGRVLKALPTAIKTGIKNASPKIKEAGGEILSSLKDGIVEMLPSSMSGIVPMFSNIVTTISPVVQQLGGMFQRVAPVIANTLGGAFANSGGIIETFASVISSAIPLVEDIIIGLADTFSYIAPIITPIVETLGGVIQAVIPVAKDVIAVFSQTIQQVMPIVSQVFSSVSSVVMPIVQAIAGLIQSAMPIISSVISTVTSAVASVMPTLISIFESIGSKVKQIVGVVQSHMPLIQSIFETVSPIVQSAITIVKDVLSGAWSIISPIIDLAIQIFDKLLSCVEKVFPKVQSVIETVWGVLEGIFSGIADGLAEVGDAISSVAGFVGNGIDTVASWFGFAYGKDRVPYDNYPAILHQGEKVLTRNQADQYDRRMSTRGVQLTQNIVELRRDNGSGGDSTGISQDVKQESKGGTNVNIEKLADTVVIEKEADVDKVVEDMITKFRKLVPNMP